MSVFHFLLRIFHRERNENLQLNCENISIRMPITFDFSKTTDLNGRGKHELEELSRLTSKCIMDSVSADLGSANMILLEIILSSHRYMIEKKKIKILKDIWQHPRRKFYRENICYHRSLPEN